MRFGLTCDLKDSVLSHIQSLQQHPFSTIKTKGAELKTTTNTNIIVALAAFL